MQYKDSILFLAQLQPFMRDLYIEAHFQHLSWVNCGNRHAARYWSDCMGLLQSHNHIGPMAALVRAARADAMHLHRLDDELRRIVRRTTAGLPADET